MKKSILTILVLVLVFITNAQTYQGIVKDTKGEAVPFANVVLYSLPDSTFVEGITTNDVGEFLLETKTPKEGYLEISFIGYEMQTVTAKENVGMITLKEATNELGEVVVKARLPKMQVRNDAFVTTVQNSVLAKAGTANNVLQRLPMLTGEDGVYTVFGKGEAKIYINNREMRDASELENLNSDDIKNVEIVTNPGARYDASVKAVVRIYTVKRVGDGFSFNVRSSYYQSENTDLYENLNMNYRKKGWDFFGTIHYKDIENLQKSSLEQTVYVDTLWSQNNKMNTKMYSKYLTLKGGVNYEISTKHFVGIKYTYGFAPKRNNKTLESNFGSVIYADRKLYDELSSKILRCNTNSQPKHIFNGYYNGTFGKLSINFDATYYTKEDKSKSTSLEGSENFDSRTVESRSDVDNQMFASKIVLTYPIWKGKLSVGNEFSNTKRDDAYWANMAVPSSATRIEQKSNSFFTEYARGTSIGQFSAGLRYESINSDYFVNNVFVSEQSKDYKQWFPSFSFATKVKGIRMQLSYSSKTNRPTYRQLSNNMSYANRFTMQSGNPFLSPSITHDVTLAGSWKFLQLMLSYKHQKDAIVYWSEQMESNSAISIVRYKNIKKLPSFTAYLGISPTFGIWSPQLSGGFQKQWLKLETNNNLQDFNKLLPFVSFNNSFKFPKNFLFTIDSRFQGRGNVQNIYLTENVFTVNLGLTKTFFENKLSVAIKGHDIFNGKKDGNLLYSEQSELYQVNRYDSQKFEITIRYKFNTAKSKYKGKGAGKSEIKRM